MKFFKIIFVFLVLFLLLGCEEQIFLFINQYQEIPEYSEVEDISPMLFNKKEEIVYNALILLIPSAEEIIENIDNSSDKIKSDEAHKILDRMTALIKSGNPRIASCAIRFLYYGIKDDYKDKAGMMKKVLSIKSMNSIVQFEQVRALTLLSNSQTKLDDRIIRKFLNNKSWMVSSAAYSLVNKLEDKALRAEMIKRYYKAAAEYDKLLILNSFADNYDKEIFDFFAKELGENKTAKIRKYIIKLFKNSYDLNLAYEYVNAGYDKFTKDDLVILNDSCCDDILSDYSIKMMTILLSKGFDPYLSQQSSEDKIPKLFYNLVNKNNKENEEKFKIMENIILTRKDLKDKWLLYKNEILKKKQ